MKRSFVMSILLIGIFVAASLMGFAAEKIQIEVWTHAGPEVEEGIGILLKEYERLNPGVAVANVTMTGEVFNEKIAVSLAGGGGPDIYNISARSMAQYYPKGFIEPMDVKALGFRTLEALKESWLPAALDPFIRDGKLYAMPRAYNIYSLFINTTAFKESGLDPETQYPKTFDEVVTVGKKLVRVDATGFMTREAVHYPFQLYWGWDMLALGPIMHVLGGEYMNEDKTKWTMNSEAGVAALQWWYDAYYTHNICSIDRAQDDLFTEVANGTICMFPGAVWARTGLMAINPDIVNHYDIVPGPAGPTGMRSVDISTWAYGVNVNSKNKLESTKVINYMLADPTFWIEVCGRMMPKKWVLDTTAFINEKGRDAWLADAPIAVPQLVHPQVEEIGQALGRVAERTLYEKMPAKESMDILAADVERIIR